MALIKGTENRGVAVDLAMVCGCGFPYTPNSYLVADLNVNPVIHAELSVSSDSLNHGSCSSIRQRQTDLHASCTLCFEGYQQGSGELL